MCITTASHHGANPLVTKSRNLAVAISARSAPSGHALALVLAVPPVPVRLLIGIVALVEIHMIPMRVVLPPVVVNRLTAPHVIVPVIRIVDAHARLASRREQRSNERRREQNQSELPSR